MRTLLLITLIILTASCADPFTYYRRGTSAERYAADVAACDHHVASISDLIYDGNTLYRLRNHCLSELGYTLTDPRTGRPWRRREVEERVGVIR